MTWLVTGATGLVGRALLKSLRGDGIDVIALSRRPRADEVGVRWLQGDPAEAGEWLEALEECRVVAHLAGEPIAEGRWNADRKRRLVASRVVSTRLIAEAIARAAKPPEQLVSASAVGYYGPRGEEELDESSPPADDFLGRLCQDWEAAATLPEGHPARTAQLRIGIVLASGGGALEKMLPPFRLGVGGPIGNARHWFPWVHLDDVVGLLRFAAGQPGAGALNAVAPGAVRMGEFARTLGRVLRRPALLPVPLAPLRLVLGEFAEHLNPGQLIRPRRALALGYRFRWPELEPALRDCVSRG